MKTASKHKSHSGHANRHSPFFQKGNQPHAPNRFGNTPAIQRNPGKAAGSSKSDKAFSNMVADILKKQLSDKSLKGHLKTLGKSLQKLAVENTDQGLDQPQSTAGRMAALNVAGAFEQTSKNILADPDLKYLRKQIEAVVRDNPEVALAAALAGLVLVLVTGTEIPVELGGGFKVGGALKVGGKNGAPDAKKIKLMASYANTYFEAKVSGEARKETPDGKTEEEWIGETQGELRLGPKHSGLTGKVKIDTNRQLTLSGKLTADVLALSRYGRKGDSFALYTEVEHSKTPEQTQTTITPGVSAKLKFGPEHFLQFGAGAKFKLGSGFQQATGSMEYGRNNLRVNLLMGLPSPIKRDRQVAPGSDTRIQLGVTLYFK